MFPTWSMRTGISKQSFRLRSLVSRSWLRSEERTQTSEQQKQHYYEQDDTDEAAYPTATRWTAVTTIPVAAVAGMAKAAQRQDEKNYDQDGCCHVRFRAKPTRSLASAVS